MPRVAYVNGRYVPHRDAAVHVEDRGHQFADAAYEMLMVIDGGLLDFAPHMERLHRSLGALSIAPPMSDSAVRVVIHELLRRNRLKNASIYIQVSRGVAPRDHAFPQTRTPPGLVMVARRMDYALIARRQSQGVSVITLAETRWARPDIKSTSLLANVLAKQEARDAGAYEALFVDADGMITEGTASNIWMVAADGTLVTRALDQSILAGITRQAVLSVTAARQMALEERPFSRAELKDAAEVFLTSSTNFVMPVTEVDGQKIGAGKNIGKPGPVTNSVIEAHREHVQKETT
ncbi:MAG: D-amino-acid transaminase [Proteobacteria bacterium]|nr:D-amino-acid transaminase [Pseudomonadota bacterium]